LETEIQPLITAVEAGVVKPSVVAPVLPEAMQSLAVVTLKGVAVFA
jgi:hypothetical protein